MIRSDTIQITPEFLGLIAKIDEFGYRLRHQVTSDRVRLYARCPFRRLSQWSSIKNTDEEHSLRISFHCADRDVTGSCHLVECAGKRVLIDCGLFQGGRELDEGEEEVMSQFAAVLGDTRVEMPARGQVYEL